MIVSDKDEADEKFIEDVLVENLWIIERDLKFIKRQRIISIGVIDILAKDKDEKFVIIEIKKDIAGNTAFTQVMSYMAALAKELKISRKMLRGIIFCKEATKKVELASNFIDELKCIEYKNLKRFDDNQTILMCLTQEEQWIVEYMRKKE